MLRGLWVLVVVIGSTAVLASAAVLGELLLPGRNLSFRIGRVWSAVNLRAAGCRVRYEGAEDLEKRPPCIFVSNHQSNLDVWALALVLPVQTRFVAKQSLFRIPIFGAALRAAGFIPVDRADREKAIQSLGAGLAWLRAGNPLLMFPEGTRSRDGRLLPFKKGPFHLAMQADCPVVPVAVNGSGGLMPPGSVVVKKGTIHVRFGKPISPTDRPHEETVEFVERTRNAVLELLRRDHSAGDEDNSRNIRK